MARRSGREEVYEVAERFVGEALKSDGSLFTSGSVVWSAENVEDLYQRFVGNPDESSDSFEDKFRRQLEGSPLETRQLAAELLYVYLLFPSNISGQKKKQIVRGILDGTNVEVPNHLQQLLEQGIASFGPSLANRPWHLTMLLEFLREWKTMPANEDVLLDPWKFKELAFSVPHSRAGVQREALLHLVHPDTFERIVSRDHKRAVTKRFSYLVGADTADVDRQILEIRQGLAPRYGDDFDFYDEEVKSLWLGEESEWSAFTRWARKFTEWERFDEIERSFKLEVASRLEKTKVALLSDEAWTQKLKEAFWYKNNLISRWDRRSFLKWCEESPAAAEKALRSLWGDSMSLPERIKMFSHLLPKEVVSGRGGKLALASVLSLADDPTDNPIYRWEPIDKAQKLLGYPSPDGSLDEASLYEHSVEFFDRFLDEASNRGLDLRDRLDAQSLIWSVVKWPVDAEPVDSWSDDERKEFLKFRGEAVDEEPWFAPLQHPPGLEAELQQRLASGSDEETRDPLGGIFRRAILSHQRVGTDGFLDSGLSIMTGRVYACTVDKILYLLVDNDPDLRNAYKVGNCALADNELMWLHVGINAPELQTLLDDEQAWAAYERMLDRFPSFSKVRSNHLNFGKLSVITGEKLDKTGPEGTLEALAEELFLDHGYLSRVDRLLKDKRQIIFYGPPGTGKTYVARRLARLYGEGSGGSSLLVQFHPSYSYEDFVEGYRPRSIGDQPGFALVEGPLKKLARRAQENPDENHVLVIDEVNRANLTKVMGELYFLLEYRGESVSLQYSEEAFSLPKNLWIICTMNTADRSIALVDAALRRRFYFAPFFPDEVPVEGLLGRWLEANRPSLLWVAEVVDEANRRLGDRDVAIGPSHFLRADLDEGWVDIIWEHAVIPYLSEQLMGEEERLEEFDLGALRAATSSNTFGDQDETPDAL